jgi:hypothetical protein
MAIPTLPNTIARLSTSITIRLIPIDNLNSSILSNPTAFTSAALQAAPIGAIESLTESNDRPAKQRFQMNAAAPGVVVELLPGLVAPRTLEVKRAVLYDSDALDALQIANGDVVFQNSPFAIVKVESAPSASTVPTRVTIYRGCWVTNNPKIYSLDNDLKIVQNMIIAYTEREVVSS